MRRDDSTTRDVADKTESSPSADTGARWLCSGTEVPLNDPPHVDWFEEQREAQLSRQTCGHANFGLLVGEDGPVYVASPEEWAEVQRAAGLGKRATGADVVAAIETARLRAAVADAIEASDNGGSSSDAIQDMLLILGTAVPS